MLYRCFADCSHESHNHDLFNRSSLFVSNRDANTAGIGSMRQTQPKVKANSEGQRVVDIHCHYLNTEVARKTSKLKTAAHDPSIVYANALTRQTNVKQMADRAAKLSDIGERIRDMDSMGVDLQVVSPAPFQYFYFTSPKLGASLARQVNEGIASIVAGNPDRFAGFGSVPLQSAELAIQELEYAVLDLKLKGVEINTQVNGLNLTDPSLGLDPFFQRAQELKAAIFLHPVGFTHAQRLTDHYFNNVIGNPLETTVALSHIIFNGVLARYPKLRIIAPHGGGYLPHYWARMDHAWRARPDSRTVIKTTPSKYLEKIYFDTITFDPRMIRNLIDRFGAKQVLLGTDYPYDMGETDPLRLIASTPGISAEEKDLLIGGNAERLLGLDTKKRPRRSVANKI
ncbi:MAG: amidohydrolase [Bacteroidetes bacterium]|nr:amidohydrolase [Bacteroidota bacterium]